MVSRIELIILVWDHLRRLELGVAAENEVIGMAMVNQVESQGLPNAGNVLVAQGWRRAGMWDTDRCDAF